MDFTELFKWIKETIKESVRPISLILLWLAMLYYTKAFDQELVTSIDFQPFQKKIVDFGGTLGLEIKLWHIILGTIIVLVSLFGFLTRIAHEINPFKIRYSSYEFWFVNKTWYPLVELLQTKPSLIAMDLYQIGLSIDLEIEKQKKEFGERYNSYVSWSEKQFSFWITLASNFVMLLFVTLILAVACNYGLTLFRARGLMLVSVVLFVFSLFCRIKAEVSVEKVVNSKLFFLFNTLDAPKDEDRQGRLNAEAALMYCYGQIGILGLPHGSFWAAHWLRQVPGFARIGVYPFRSFDSIRKNYSPAFQHMKSTRSNRSFVTTVPHYVSHQAINSICLWLLKAGIVKNGGSFVGSEIDLPQYERMWHGRPNKFMPWRQKDT